MASCYVSGCTADGPYKFVLPGSETQLNSCWEHLPTVCKEIMKAEQANQERGMKFHCGKPRMSLLPPHALEEVAKVYTYGAEKYDAWNWLKGISFSEYLDSVERHILAFRKGEDRDPDTGDSRCHHLASACFGLLAIMQFQAMSRDDLDDRPRALLDMLKK